MNPRKQKTAPDGSRRAEGEQRRIDAHEDALGDDERAEVDVVKVVIGLFVLFTVGALIDSRLDSDKAQCAVAHAGQAADIAACQDDVEMKKTVWGLIGIVLMLAAGGLYKRHQSKGA